MCDHEPPHRATGSGGTVVERTYTASLIEAALPPLLHIASQKEHISPQNLLLKGGPPLIQKTSTASILSLGVQVQKAAMAEGAHLTGGKTRFCCKSSKCCNYAPFVGESSNMPYESVQDLEMCPLQTKNLTQMCPFTFLRFKSN